MNGSTLLPNGNWENPREKEVKEKAVQKVQENVNTANFLIKPVLLYRFNKGYLDCCCVFICLIGLADISQNTGEIFNKTFRRKSSS